MTKKFDYLEEIMKLREFSNYLQEQFAIILTIVIDKIQIHYIKMIVIDILD